MQTMRVRTRWAPQVEARTADPAVRPGMPGRAPEDRDARRTGRDLPAPRAAGKAAGSLASRVTSARARTARRVELTVRTDRRDGKRISAPAAGRQDWARC